MYQLNSRVRYSEVNSEQQLTLSALIEYLQDCCTFQSEDMGVGMEYLQQEHSAWVLSSWEIRVLRYPKMGENIQVSTWPCDFKGFYGTRNFLITDESGEIIAKANSLWVFMDTERMRPKKVPAELIEAYQRETEEPLAEEWHDRKIAIPQEGEAKEFVQVARFHIDTNHHMNNGKYVQVAEEYLPEEFMVKGLRAEYKKAAVLGDTLHPKVTREEDTVTVVLADSEDKPYAIVQFLNS